MMNFRTVIPVPALNTIGYEHQFLMLGSCFAETIGSKLLEFRFSGEVNPFGVLYNPVSIAQSLERLLEHRAFTEAELFEYNGLWHSWAHHGSFSDVSTEKTLEKINMRYAAAEKMVQSDVLILTFGSSWVYEYDGRVVANCHKVPEKQFVRRRLSVDEIVERYGDLFRRLLHDKPEKQIILSVSPIRYLRNGATENQTNKAILLLAVEKLCQMFDAVHYFPAYEIVLDELRDYRFFADDMIHPSVPAVAYIWERFCESFLTKPTLALMPKVEKLNKALLHRPLNGDSEAYKYFMLQTKQEIRQLKQMYPYLNI